MTDNDDTFLTSEELAERWKLSINTIKMWRVKGKGPDYVKIGSSVRYPMKDVKSYEDGMGKGD